MGLKARAATCVGLALGILAIAAGPAAASGGGGGLTTKVESGAGLGSRIRQWLMTGVSYVIPFVAAGGLLIALGFALGGWTIDKAPKVDGALNRPDAVRLGQLPGEQGKLADRTQELEEALAAVGSIVYNVELKPGKGGQLARSAGSSPWTSYQAACTAAHGAAGSTPAGCSAKRQAASKPSAV